MKSSKHRLVVFFDSRFFKAAKFGGWWAYRYYAGVYTSVLISNGECVWVLPLLIELAVTCSAAVGLTRAYIYMYDLDHDIQV